MTNLLERFKKLDRSYYAIKIPKDIFADNSERKCKDFIVKHFECGCKREVMEVPFLEKFKEKGKHCHTVSLYLMGLLGEKYFSGCIERTLNPLIDINGWYDFKYTWFLTCMYHDIASCIEKERDSFEEKKQLEHYLEEKGVLYTPYKYRPIKEDACLTRFEEQLIKNYFWYRKSSNSFDHGIIGGYLLFDRFYKNFMDKTSKEDWESSSVKKIKGLQWRKEHIDHSAYIADAIVCHNIWLCYDEAKSEIYKKYNLDELIVNDSNDIKLDIRKYPLQFVLCLLDTIEPVKRFGIFDPEKILSNIDIKFLEDGLEIEWTEEFEREEKTEAKEQSQFTKWINGVQELDKWMKVHIISDDENRKIAIRFL